MQYKFRLKKVHCSGCALALEQKLNSLDGVAVSINFVTKTMVVDIETENPAETLTEVKIEVHKFDHSIEILPFEEEIDEEEKERIEKLVSIIKFSASIFLMVLAFLIPVKWLKITIFALSYIVVSYETLISSAINISHGKVFDENFLMSIASIGAFIIGEYFEAVMVMLLFGIGEMLEGYAVERSKKSISSVLEIKQPYANLVTDAGEFRVELSKVKVGSLIRILPGERVPLDATVIEGVSHLDVSALTGESKERVVTVGDSILSGSINGSSVLLAKVEKLESESTVSKIVDMVQNATETKAKTEKFISKFAKFYTPVVIALAVMIMFVPSIFMGFEYFSEYAYRALCFLVVSCPCALVISVPLTYFAGIGASSKIGVMIKGATYLEALAKADSVVFDKTGTLTEGNFEISEIFAVDGKTEDEILEIAAYAESYSNHRIAKSIMKAYRERFQEKEINTAWIDGYTEIAGEGIKANIFMQDVLVGNVKLLKDNDINVVEMQKAGTTLYVSIAGEFAGYIVISDMIKKDSKAAIEALSKLGIKDISICTGDEENVAKAISSKLGIKNYYSGLLPDEKVDIILDKYNSGETVVFVGDGINDAPSLATANVGVSMGGFGSDIAVEASDVVVMTDEPSKVAEIIKKAKKTRRIVLENIIGSIGIKVAILALTAFGFAGMWLAIFADVGVSLLAVLNSLRAFLK